jgi:hypothetical protein
MSKLATVINIVLLLAIGIILFCIFGCNPQRKIDRNDLQALDRVSVKPALLNQAGALWEKSHPCINDTLVQYIKGDTLYSTNTDTLLTPIEVPGDAVIKTVTKTITKTVRDTIKLTVEDVRRFNIAKDTANYYIGLSIQKQAQIDTLNTQVKQTRKAKILYLIWAIAATIAAIYFAIRKLFI